MNFGNKLRVLRERKGLSLVDISKILNISDSLYSRYEKEIQLIPIKHINTLCNFYNVSLDYIFSFTETYNYDNITYTINKDLAGQRLREFRKEKNLTQKKLAETLNTVAQVISKYEKGINLIATPFLYDLCKKYKISADYLLGKIDNPKYLK
ncbi:MAG: helix-turn-helix domain-containing protein [Ruminococcus sp.]|nr:helix-turn-helix domain-containing protein [Ruminococcus sp.]